MADAKKRKAIILAATPRVRTAVPIDESIKPPENKKRKTPKPAIPNASEPEPQKFDEVHHQKFKFNRHAAAARKRAITETKAIAVDTEVEVPTFTPKDAAAPRDAVTTRDTSTPRDAVTTRDTVTAKDAAAPRDTPNTKDTRTTRDTVTAKDAAALRDTPNTRDTITTRDTVTTKDTSTPRDTRVAATAKDKTDTATTLETKSVTHVYGNAAAQAGIVKYLKQQPLTKTMTKPILLVSGPPGVGKSTAVEYHLRRHNFDPVVFNLSDTRNLGFLVDTSLSKIYKQSTSKMKSLMSSGPPKPARQQAIVLEEFDGFDSRADETDTEDAPGSAGLAPLYALVQHFKHQSRFTPIVCVVNELTRSAILGMSKNSLVQHVKFGRLAAADMMVYFGSVLMKKYPYLKSTTYSEQKQLIAVTNGDMRQLDNHVAFYNRPCSSTTATNKDALVDSTPELFRDVAAILMPDYTKQKIEDTETLFIGDPFIHSCMVHENYPALLTITDAAPAKTWSGSKFIALLELLPWISKESPDALAQQTSLISKKVYIANDDGCELLIPGQPKYAKLSFKGSSRCFVAPVVLVRYILERRYIPNPTSQVLVRRCATQGCLAIKHLTVCDAATGEHPIACDLTAGPSDNAVSIMASVARALYDDSMLSSEWSDNGGFLGLSILQMSAAARVLYLANLGSYQPKSRYPPRPPNIEFTKLPGQISKQRRRKIVNVATVSFKDTKSEIKAGSKVVAPRAMTLKQLLEKSKHTTDWCNQQFETVLRLKLAAIVRNLDELTENEDLKEILELYTPRHTLFIVHTCATLALAKAKPPKWFLELLQSALST